ncbi:MAG: sugar phosphate isomerase/epimerase family protein [Bryobacteraceae bacterium]
MTRGVSTYLFLGERVAPSLLEQMADAGAERVELFCARQSFDYRDRGQISELARWFRDSPLRLHSLHGPVHNTLDWNSRGPHTRLPITEPDRGRRRQSVDEIKRAIEVAESLPYAYFIQHLGSSREEYDPRKIEAAWASLEELNAFARDLGVEILLENLANGTATPERLIELVTETRLPNGFCLDTGHAQLSGGVEAAFDAMKERVRSTHIHGNDGVKDQHLAPLDGSLDWKRAMELLRSRAHQYPLMLELRGKDLERGAALELVRRAFERLESLW